MSEQCLELKNVCKSFRDFTLNNISFTLPQGYIMGLVGPNGAGKTTTIQLILNMLEKDAGKILAFGKDNVVSEKEIKQDIGIVFDSIFYVDGWTVKDTEKAVSIFYDNWRHDIFNDMLMESNAARVIKAVTNTPLDIPEDAEVIDVCKAVEDMMNESKTEGAVAVLAGLVKDGLLSLKEAARRANMTESAFEAEVKKLS